MIGPLLVVVAVAELENPVFVVFVVVAVVVVVPVDADDFVEKSFDTLIVSAILRWMDSVA